MKSCRMPFESQSSAVPTIFYFCVGRIAFLLRGESSLLFFYYAQRQFGSWRLNVAAMRLSDLLGFS
jgi:hypothetical protein